MNTKEGISAESSPEIKKDELIAQIEENGLKDGETHEMFLKWEEQQEDWVEREGTRCAQIEFEMDRADLYAADGDIDVALEILEDVRAIAEYEFETDMLMKVTNKIEEILKKG